MTVSSDIYRVTFNGDGATTVFSWTNPTFQGLDDITVTLRDVNDNEVPWTRGSQYTLTGAGDPNGGVLTVLTSPTDYTPQTGESLVIELEPEIKQETDLLETGDLPVEEIEKALDKLTRICGRLFNLLDRTVQVPVTDTAVGSFVLPLDSVRASKFLAFDASGLPIAATTITTSPVSAWGATLIDDADAAAGRTTLGSGIIGDDVFISDTQDEARGFMGTDSTALWIERGLFNF